MKTMRAVLAQYDWDSKFPDTEVEIPTGELESLEVSYDGGRLYIYINGYEVYKNLGAGNDFSLEIK